MFSFFLRKKLRTQQCILRKALARNSWLQCVNKGDRKALAQQLTIIYLDAVRSQLPLAFHWISMTVDLCACRVVNTVPVFGSQILTGCWLSLDPDANRPLVGCQSTHLTSDPWPRRTRSSVQLKKSQTRTVPSSEHEANFASVGLKLTHRTGSLCAWNIFTLFMLDCQYLIYPPWSPVTIQVSLWDHFMALTGLSCACCKNTNKSFWFELTKYQ
jgi:hypothetical protein